MNTANNFSHDNVGHNSYIGMYFNVRDVFSEEMNLFFVAITTYFSLCQFVSYYYSVGISSLDTPTIEKCDK